MHALHRVLRQRVPAHIAFLRISENAARLSSNSGSDDALILYFNNQTGNL